jgi:hypothetical protein
VTSLLDNNDRSPALRGALAGVFCGPADNLQIASWNSLAAVTALTITGRFLTVEGAVVDIQEQHVPLTNRTIKTTLHALGEGWLLDLSIVSNGAPLMGQVFVRATLVRGLSGTVTPIKTLAQGYCNAIQRLAFPGSPIVTSTQAPGAIVSVDGVDPAAGAECSVTVPTGARWRLLAFRCALITSAVVANREPALNFSDGVNTFAAYPAGAAHAATTTRIYSWTRGAIRAAAGVSGDSVIPIGDLWLPAGFVISTVTANFDVGDNWQFPRLLVEEVLEAAA